MHNPARRSYWLDTSPTPPHRVGPPRGTRALLYTHASYAVPSVAHARDAQPDDADDAKAERAEKLAWRPRMCINKSEVHCKKGLRALLPRRLDGNSTPTLSGSLLASIHRLPSIQPLFRGLGRTESEPRPRWPLRLACVRREPLDRMGCLHLDA
eukprot:scaffold141_cov410-Prasinococcus_capsulatus_cf.AAC.19